MKRNLSLLTLFLLLSALVFANNENPQPTIAGSTSFCAGGSTVLDAGAGYATYEWNTTALTQTIEVTLPGEYSVTVTDATGCTGEASVMVMESTVLIPTIAPVSFCEGSCVSLEYVGGIYQWVNDGTDCITHDTTFMLTVSDASGCTAMQEVSVSFYSNPEPIISVNSTNQLDAGPGWTSYEWSTGEFTQTITPMPTNPNEIYCVTITDFNGCTGSNCVDYNIVIVGTALSIAVSNIQAISCYGEADGAIDIIINGGTAPYIFNWNNGLDTEDITGLTAGIYSVTVTNADNSTATQSFEITEPEPLAIFIGTNSNLVVSCPGEADGTINTIVTGGTAPYTFAWNNGLDTEDIAGLTAGIYNIIVTDANNCTAQESFTISESSPFSIGFPNTILTCLEPCINLDILPGYSIQWSTSNPPDPNGICVPGTYLLTITDSNGCTNTQSLEVTVDENIPSVILDQADESTCGCKELLLEGTSTGGNFSYAWSGPSWESIDGKTYACANGTYSLTVTDNENGCLNTASLEVVLDDDSQDEGCIWPGDTDDNGVVDNFDCLPIGLAFGATGTVRPGGDATWRAQYPLPWAETTPGTDINYMHIDCDGGGSIGDEDFEVMETNWGLTHNFTDDDDPNYKDLEADNRSPFEVLFYVESDTLAENTDAVLDLILGEETAPLVGAYGIAFSLIYDPMVVVPNTALLTWEDSWLGEIGVDMYAVQKDFHAEGRIDVGVTRLDGMEMDGFGKLASLNITIEDVILFKGTDENKSSDITTFFNIKNYRIITASETEIVANALETATVLTDSLVATYSVELSQEIDLFPNPANQQIYLNSKSYDLQAIELYHINGQLILHENLSASSPIVDISTINSGLYLVKIYTNEGIAFKKLSVQ